MNSAGIVSTARCCDVAVFLRQWSVNAGERWVWLAWLRRYRMLDTLRTYYWIYEKCSSANTNTA